MSIRMVQAIVKSQQAFKYITKDGEEFFDIDEAVEHENKLASQSTSKKFVPYEQIWSIQEAINKAIGEGRVVRFLWKASNKEIKKSILDKKDCRILKPDKDSSDVAVIPPCIETFDFEEVE
jgi:phosphopantetheinyl transferase